MGDETNNRYNTNLYTPGAPLPYQWGNIPAEQAGFNYLNGDTSNLFPQVAGLSGDGSKPLTWQNPYAWNSWGAGLDPSASFGTKLGSFVGGNAPLFMGGLQTLSGGIQAYTGLKGVSLAQKALQQEKKAFNINLSNQTQSYNTQVGDRIAGRSYASEAERQAALAAAQLVDRSKYGKGG